MGKLAHLEEVGINGDGLTNDDLKDITSLRPWYLQINIPVNDEGALYLSQIKSLKHLCLSSIIIEKKSVLTDVGVELLSHLDNLVSLTIEGSFTDEGIQPLASLKSLRDVYLNSPKVTEEGVQSMMSKMPSLSGVHYQGKAVPFPKFRRVDKDPIRRGFILEPSRQADQEELEGKTPPAWQVSGWGQRPGRRTRPRKTPRQSRPRRFLVHRLQTVPRNDADPEKFI